MKTLKKLGIFLLAILGLFLIVPALLTLVFQAKIENAALAQLKQLTNDQLIYEDADLNFISSFPSITLDLNHPKLYDKEYNETISLEQFQIKLNVLKSIFSTPQINKILIKNGSVVLKERNNRWNVEDLITSNQSKESSNALINIKDIEIENFRIYIDQTSTSEKASILFKDGNIALTSDKTHLKINASGSIIVDEISKNSTKTKIQYEDFVSTTLQYGLVSKQLDIENIDFEKGVRIKGNFNTLNSKRDIIISVDDYDLKYWNSVFRSNTNNPMSDYRLIGKLNGQIQLNDLASYDYNISLSKGGILKTLNNQDYTITGIHSNIVGNDKTMQFKESSAKIDGTLIKGNVHLNPEKKLINELNLKGAIPTSLLYVLYEDTVYEKLKGKLSLDKLYIQNCNWNELADCIPFATIAGTLDDVVIKEHHELPISLPSGKISSDNGVIKCEQLKCNYKYSPMSFSGEYQYDPIREKTIIRGSLDAEVIDLDSLFGSAGSDSTTIETNFLQDYDLDLTIHTEVLSVYGGTINDVSCKLYQQDGSLNYNIMSEAFDGTSNIEGDLIQLSNGFHNRSTVETQSISISDALQKTNNLGQQFVTEANLKGALTSVGIFDFYFDKEWQLDKPKTKGLLSVNVKDGEIVDLEMMKQFSKFIKVRDLEEIKFSELHNYLEIQGKNLYIPSMFIQSNACNLTLSGTHTMDQDIMYNVQVNAGQILWNKIKKHDSSLKPKKAKKKGWFNMYYRITGNIDQYEYKRDRTKVEAALDRGFLRKEDIYRALVDEFGYLPELKIPDDWYDIPEF